MSMHASVVGLYKPEDVDGATPSSARIDDFTMAGIQARQKFHLAPASADRQRIAVILVDYQYDFVDPKGALYVPGAREDVKRFLHWFYTNGPRITTLYASLDTHRPQHIFFRTWWKDQKGNYPKPFTEITIEDVEAGRWIPVYDEEWSRSYVQALRTHGKRPLMIWPYHAMEGTLGHMLVPTISEAIAWHSALRDTPPEYIVKGRTRRTEYYGIFGAEIVDNTDVKTKLNHELLGVLMNHDLVYVAGEAKSHCVMESVRQIQQYLVGARDILKRLHFLVDCTSSIPDAPHNRYDHEAEAWLSDAENRWGMRRVKSTTPIPS